MMRYLTFVLALAVAVPAAAQQQLSVSAVLPVQSPTGAGQRNLAFGSIVPGAATVTVSVPAAAAPQSATVMSGEFRFGVATNRGMQFDLSLPAQLSAAGLTPLAVSYNGNQYGAWCVSGGGNTCTLTTFDPSSATSHRMCAQTLGNGNCHPTKTWAAGSQLSVFIGGLLTVPPGARPGTYTATITLTITQVY